MGKIKNRTGDTYGDLTVIKFAGLNLIGQANWECRCSCGRTVVTFGGNLNSGHTESCGCKRGWYKHGESGKQRSPEYQTLAGIINRCTSPNNRQFYLYGGRGIRVYDGWNSMEKFPAFLAYIGRRPTAKHSIDRWPNKNGNYEPGNIRWATLMEQASNTRKNVYVEFNGEQIHLAALARKVKIHPATLRYRIRRGWPILRAVAR